MKLKQNWKYHLRFRHLYKMFTCLGGSWSPNRPTNSRSTSVRPRAKARTRRPRLAMRLAACSSTYASFWSSGWLEPLALYCLHRGKISSIAPFYHNEPKLRIAFRNCWAKTKVYFVVYMVCRCQKILNQSSKFYMQFLTGVW